MISIHIAWMATKEPIQPFSTQVSDTHYYHLNFENGTSQQTNVAFGGRELCNPDYEVNRTRYPYYCIEFVVKGRGTVTLGGIEYSLEQGSLFSYGPHTAHIIRSHPKQRLKKYFVVFRGRQAAALIKNSPIDVGKKIKLTAFHEITHLYDQLYREGAKQTKFTATVCNHYLHLLILKIEELHQRESVGFDRSRETYSQARHYIDEHFLELHTLEDIAGGISVDTSYLCRLFKKFHAPSPYQLLVRKKMNYALELLHNTGLSVQSTAHQVGFDDPYHFSRVFKKVHGLAPKYFRKTETY